jgi:hypothetical protein
MASKTIRWLFPSAIQISTRMVEMVEMVRRRRRSTPFHGKLHLSFNRMHENFEALEINVLKGNQQPQQYQIGITKNTSE